MTKVNYYDYYCVVFERTKFIPENARTEIAALAVFSLTLMVFMVNFNTCL